MMYKDMYDIFYYTWALVGLVVAVYDLLSFVIYLVGSIAMGMTIIAHNLAEQDGEFDDD